MKKLKKFWRDNSVLLVLLLILFACLIAITVVVVTYFVGDSNTKYGERTSEVSKHPFSKEEQKEIERKFEEDETIEKATIRVTDTMTIIITLNFTSETSLVEAQSKSLASLEYFSEDILGFYDIEYNIYADSTEDTEGYQISGSHNVSGTGGIVWNNNTVVDSEDE